MAESERFDEGIQSWDIPSVLIIWIQEDIGSSSFSQVIAGGGSAWRYQIHEIKCEVYDMEVNLNIFTMKWQTVNAMQTYVRHMSYENKMKCREVIFLNQLYILWIPLYTHLIADLHTYRIPCSDNNKVLWVFKMWSHWMRISVPWNTEPCKLIYTRKGNYLLLGFFAHTISEGGLGSPDPDSLIAETLNSYSAPSVTSFMACFTSENAWI